MEFLISEGMKSGLLYPVTRDGRSIGLLEVFCRGEYHWDQEELAYLDSVSAKLGDVLARIDGPRRVARP